MDEPTNYECFEQTIKALQSACASGGVPNDVCDKISWSLGSTRSHQAKEREDAVITASATTKEFWDRASEACGEQRHELTRLFMILYHAGSRMGDQNRTEAEVKENREYICSLLNQLIELIEAEPVSNEITLVQVLSAMSKTELKEKAREVMVSQAYGPVLDNFPTATEYLRGLQSGFENGFWFDPENPRPKGTRRKGARHLQLVEEISKWFTRLECNIPENTANSAARILKYRNIEISTADEANLIRSARRRLRNKQDA